MSQRNDIDDIVRSFVADDLASLDRIGENEPSKLELSPELLSLPKSPSMESTVGSVTSRKPVSGSGGGAGPSTLAPQPSHSASRSISSGAYSGSNPRTPNLQTPPASQSHPSTPGSRSVSQASTKSAGSDTRTSSLGTKFKSFGRRLASGGHSKKS